MRKGGEPIPVQPPFRLLLRKVNDKSPFFHRAQHVKMRMFVFNEKAVTFLHITISAPQSLGS
jgi:hypothetical protein